MGAGENTSCLYKIMYSVFDEVTFSVLREKLLGYGVPDVGGQHCIPTTLVLDFSLHFAECQAWQRFICRFAEMPSGWIFRGWISVQGAAGGDSVDLVHSTQ